MADLRAEDEMFIIFDTTAQQEEEDEIKDAIVVFHPQIISEERQWDLLGQLVGALHCVQDVAGSIPNSLTLQQNRFAVRYQGNYLMFCEREKKCLKNYLQQIWENYIPLYRQIGNPLHNALQHIPYVRLPKHSSCAFLRASHLLQVCSRQEGVLGGCLLLRDRLLCSELNTDITLRLLIIKPKQNNLPCTVPHSKTRLPSGVRVISVFLTQAEAEDVDSSKPQWLQRPGAARTSFRSRKRVCSKQKIAETDSKPACITAPTSCVVEQEENNKQTIPINTCDSNINEEETHTLNCENQTDNQVWDSSDTNIHIPSAVPNGVHCDIEIDDAFDGVEKSNNNIYNEAGKKIMTEATAATHTLSTSADLTKLENHRLLDCLSSASSISTNQKVDDQVYSESYDNNVGTRTLFGVKESIKQCLQTLENGKDYYNKCTDHQTSKCDDCGAYSLLQSKHKSGIGQVVSALDSTESENSTKISSQETPKKQETAELCYIESRENVVYQKEVNLNDMSKEEIGSTGNGRNGLMLSRSTFNTKESRTAHFFRRVKDVVAQSADPQLHHLSADSLEQPPLDRSAITSKEYVAYRTRALLPQSSSSPALVTISPTPLPRHLHAPSTVAALPQASFTATRSSSKKRNGKLQAEAARLQPNNRELALNVHGKYISSDDSRYSGRSDGKRRFRRRNGGKKSSDTTSSSTANLKLGKKMENCSEMLRGRMRRYELYIQSNAELVLMLLLDDATCACQAALSSLWRSALPLLGELDMLMKQTTEEVDSLALDSRVNYITYDSQSKNIAGNIWEPITALQHQFCDTTVVTHDLFSKMPELTDLCIRNANTSVYGHRHGNHQTYIQPKGLLRPIAGLPSELDSSVTMDTKDLHKLANYLHQAFL